MSKTLGTTLVVIAVVALAGGLFFFGTMVGRSNGFAPGTSPRLNNNTYGPGQMMQGQGWNNGEDFGPGMMGRQSGYGMQPDTATLTPPSLPSPSNRRKPQPGNTWQP